MGILREEKIRFNPFKRFTKASFHIPEKLAAYDGLSWPVKAVYGALLRFHSSPIWSPETGVWPNLKTIGELVGMKKNSVSDHIKTLIKEGFVEVEEIDGDHHYFMTWHPVFGDLPHDLIPKPKPKHWREAFGFPNGSVRFSELGCSVIRTGCSVFRTGCSVFRTPCNKDGSMSMKHDHESSSSLPKAGEVLESNMPTREQLEKESEVNLLHRLEPMAGANFYRIRYGNWLKVFKKSDIRELLIRAILEDRTIDWVNEQLEARRAQRKDQQGGNQHAGSTNRRSSGFGL